MKLAQWDDQNFLKYKDTESYEIKVIGNCYKLNKLHCANYYLNGDFQNDYFVDFGQARQWCEEWARQDGIVVLTEAQANLL